MAKGRRTDYDEYMILELDFEDWYNLHKERYRNLAGIRRHLNNRFGKGNWGDDEFVQYMHEIYETRRAKIAAKRRQEEEKNEPLVPIDSASIEERLAAYLGHFESPAPNDLVLLRQMAAIEIQLDHVQQRWATAVADGDRTAAKTWAEMLKSMTTEHRNIQQSLGIDRGGRDKTRSQSDLVSYVQDIIRKTADFVDEHAIKIRCPHCMAAQSKTEIDMGFILFHFRQDVPWHFEFQCPLCEETIRLP